MSSDSLIPAMHVRMSKGGLPPFYEIGAMPFQDMCRDLYAERTGIATCEIYGKPGEKQYGIDLIASISDKGHT